MSRPKQNEKIIIKKRNELIMLCLKEFNQSQTAQVFRLPRNTVSVIARKYDNERVLSNETM
jgi:hypothetical protein